MANCLEFFGLANEPFESAGMSPLVLETGPLRRAVAWLRAELAAERSSLCVRGASGVGKSRLAFALPHVLDQRAALIPDPTISWQEIEAATIEQLGLSELSWVPSRGRRSRAPSRVGRPGKGRGYGISGTMIRAGSSSSVKLDSTSGNCSSWRWRRS